MLFEVAAQELCDVGRFAFERGWLPATSGNLSARYDRGMAITRSGAHKGELHVQDILDADLQGKARTGKPSAETGIHVHLYERFPDAGAVLHTHSPRATVLSRGRTALVFEGYEIQKAFEGFDTHESRVVLPVVPNDQDIPRLVTTLEPLALTAGFLIEGHGVYTWARSVADARRHLEALEFLFECECVRQQLGGAS